MRTIVIHVRCEMGRRWLSCARPLLGTLVEIGVPQGHDAAVVLALEAIEQVQRLMSIHGAKSDVSRRSYEAPAGEPIDIHPGTGEVLLAANLSMQTGGLFDVARGSGKGSAQVTNGVASAVRHEPSCRPHLGGIAKGWAVDRAVDTLIASGLEALWVNAGGECDDAKLRQLAARHGAQICIHGQARPGDWSTSSAEV